MTQAKMAMKKKELQEMAKGLGLEFDRSATKGQLVELINFAGTVPGAPTEKPQEVANGICGLCGGTGRSEAGAVCEGCGGLGEARPGGQPSPGQSAVPPGAGTQPDLLPTDSGHGLGESVPGGALSGGGGQGSVRPSLPAQQESAAGVVPDAVDGGAGDPGSGGVEPAVAGQSPDQVLLPGAVAPARPADQVVLNLTTLECTPVDWPDVEPLLEMGGVAVMQIHAWSSELGEWVKFTAKPWGDPGAFELAPHELLSLVEGAAADAPLGEIKQVILDGRAPF